jgi:hypothetical protein
MSQPHTQDNTAQADPSATMTWFIGFIGVALLITILLGVTALLKTVERQADDELLVNANYTEYDALKNDQHAELERTMQWEAYVDPSGNEQERLVIPIDRGISIIAEEWADGSNNGPERTSSTLSP